MLSRSYVKLWLSHLKSDAKTSWLVDLLSPETLKVGNVKVETKYWQIMMSRICPREIDETDRYDWSNITSSYIFQMRGSCCFALVLFFLTCAYWHFWKKMFHSPGVVGYEKNNTYILICMIDLLLFSRLEQSWKNYENQYFPCKWIAMHQSYRLKIFMHFFFFW